LITNNILYVYNSSAIECKVCIYANECRKVRTLNVLLGQSQQPRWDCSVTSASDCKR